MVNDLELKRKQIVFRAWHRGIKEMDYILGRFVDSAIHALSVLELSELQYIMSFEDRDLLSWFMGEQPVPKELDRPMFYNIANFHAIKLPKC